MDWKGVIVEMITLQDFIQTIKDDLDLFDLPATVSDEDILNRLRRGALHDFSIVYPRREKFRLTYNDICEPEKVIGPRSRGIDYAIPKWFLIQYSPVNLIRVEAFRQSDYYGDVFAYTYGYDPTDLITDIAGVKAVAGMTGNMAHAPTYNWDSAKNIITLYNAYYDGCYEVEMGVMHDMNLQSIPPTAMITFKQLATYDIGHYIYGKLFRKENVETGAGSITLNIQKLQDCEQKYNDLIKELTDEAALDNETLEYF